jgi:hypothetical protein
MTLEALCETLFPSAGSSRDSTIVPRQVWASRCNRCREAPDILDPAAASAPPLTLRRSDGFDLSKSGNATDFFVCCCGRRAIRFAIEGATIGCGLVAEADSRRTSMCLSGRLVVVGCEGGQIDIFDADLMLQIGAAPVRSVAALSGGRVAAGCHDGSLYVMSTADPRRRAHGRRAEGRRRAGRRNGRDDIRRRLMRTLGSEGRRQGAAQAARRRQRQLDLGCTVRRRAAGRVPRDNRVAQADKAVGVRVGAAHRRVDSDGSARPRTHLYGALGSVDLINHLRLFRFFWIEGMIFVCLANQAGPHGGMKNHKTPSEFICETLNPWISGCETQRRRRSDSQKEF